jgi:hypothetical protein
MGRISSKFGYEQLLYDSEGQPFFRRCENDTCTVTRDISLTEKGYCKSMIVAVVVHRQGYSPDMLPMHYYGLQKIKITVPDDMREYRYTWLYFDTKRMSLPCMTDFNPKVFDVMGHPRCVTSQVSLSDTNFCKYVGRPRKLKGKFEADALVREKVALMIVEGDLHKETSEYVNP